MDMEELSKSQTVLLVLLVSFVTSMATGIVTVSPSETAAVATPKTIVVKESSQIATAVQKSSPSVVRLYSDDGSTFLGLGVVLDSAGTIVSDMGALGGAARASVTIANGAIVHAVVTTHLESKGIVFLSIATSSLATSTPVWIPMSLSSTAASLGETVVLMAGQSNPWVGSGLVSSLLPASDSSIALVKTDISGDNVLYGSPLIDTSGNLVGLSTEVSRAVAGSAFVPASGIVADIGKKMELGATK